MILQMLGSLLLFCRCKYYFVPPVFIYKMHKNVSQTCFKQPFTPNHTFGVILMLTIFWGYSASTKYYEFLIFQFTDFIATSNLMVHVPSTQYQAELMMGSVIAVMEVMNGMNNYNKIQANRMVNHLSLFCYSLFYKNLAFFFFFCFSPYYLCSFGV